MADSSGGVVSASGSLRNTATRGLALLVALALAVGCSGKDAAGPDTPLVPAIAGPWTIAVRFNGLTASQASMSGSITFVQPSRSSSALTGTVAMSGVVGGQLFTANGPLYQPSVSEAGVIVFQAGIPSGGASWVFSGAVTTADQMSGSHTLTSSGSTNTGTWTATRLGSVPTISTLTVNPPAPEFEAGTLAQFSATATWSDGTSGLAAAVWSSSTPTVATITANGQFQAISAGTTTITATLGGKQASAAITITNFAGTYALSTVNGVAPPVNFNNADCRQPPLITVCVQRDFIIGATLVLNAGAATFYDRHRIETTVNSTSSTSFMTDTLRGSYFLRSGAIELDLTRRTTAVTIVGLFSGTSVRLLISSGALTLSYLMPRQ